MPGPWTSTITISWNANTEPDLAGYRIYSGTSSGSYGTPVQVGAAATSGQVDITASATWFFAVTAFDTSNNESGFSTEVSRAWLLLGNF